MLIVVEGGVVHNVKLSNVTGDKEIEVTFVSSRLVNWRAD